MTPPNPTIIALPLNLINVGRSVSSPDPKRRNIDPMVEIAYNSGETGIVESGIMGNNGPKLGNGIAPSKYGPISIPATSSPKTFGCCRKREKMYPKNLATMRMIPN